MSSVATSTEDSLLDLKASSTNCRSIETQLGHRVSNRNLFLTCAAMSLGSLCLGITLGMSSPMIPDMQNDKSPHALNLTDSDYTWFGSVVTLGAMAGGILGGAFIQFFGRKFTAMLCGIPYVGGMLLMAYAVNVPMLLLGRTITGISGGVASLVVPTYISEASTTELRGLLGTTTQISMVIGVLFSYALSLFLTWRWVALASAVPCAMLTLFTAFIPETPRFLLLQQKRKQAQRSLVILRGKKANIDEELKLLEANISKSVGSASWVDVFREKSIRIPLLLSLGMLFFQQASGINCVMFYSKTIFEDAGFTSETLVNVSMFLLPTVQLLGSLVSGPLMDRAGRKVLLILSGCMMALSSGTFGLYFQLVQSKNGTNSDSGFSLATLDSEASSDLNWLALSSSLLYIAGFSIGLASIPWLLLSEIMPIRARGKASGLSTGLGWFLGFIFTKEFDDMQKAFTTQGTFWIFSGISVIGAFYHAIFIPETKGRTLEEISAHFEGNTGINNDCNSETDA